MPLFGNPSYRLDNLGRNGIYMRDMYEELPQHIQSLVEEMLFTVSHPWPEPTVEEIKNDRDLWHLRNINGAEDEVINYIQRFIFTHPEQSQHLQGLSHQAQIFSIRRRHIPRLLDHDYPISKPKPDILYGYAREAFTLAQRHLLRLNAADHNTNKYTDVFYPFFVIQVKGDGPGPTAGSLWVGENQCMGGAVTCINMADKLNQSVPAMSAMETAVFSVVMDGSQARLFVSWKEGGKYYTQLIKWLLVNDPEHHLQLRRFVRNVLAWGKGRRLAQLGAALDALMKARGGIFPASYGPNCFPARGGYDGPFRLVRGRDTGSGWGKWIYPASRYFLRGFVVLLASFLLGLCSVHFGWLSPSTVHRAIEWGLGAEIGV
jgi:hypothetical protein